MSFQPGTSIQGVDGALTSMWVYRKRSSLPSIAIKHQLSAHGEPNDVLGARQDIGGGEIVDVHCNKLGEACEPADPCEKAES